MRTRSKVPPASNPAIATDGFSQTMALWRTEAGKTALAACPSTDGDCPAGGAVTAVWVHDDVGDVTQRQFRIHTATYQNGVWSAISAVDPDSGAAETEPAIAYVSGHPLAAWVRDADREASTITDRRLALRFLDGDTIQTPEAIPAGILNPDLNVDSQGDVQMAFTVLDAQDKLISNRRQL